MALVTLQRSPTPSAASSASTATTAPGEDCASEDERRANQSLSESFFMVKGAALFLQQGSSHPSQKTHPQYKHAGDLPQHLQVMINILRSEDRIKLAVRLESVWSDRVRYMVVVYTSGRQDTEENILLGIDFTNKDCKSCSIGMVLPLWSDAKIHLDGDGGFTVSTANRTHIFKPVSVQAMWSALQVLHKACELSRRFNYFPGGMALTWMGYYDSGISSDQSCINEWNIMKDLETTRPDSPILFVDMPTERERTECLIKSKLRSIMTCQDLENVTCKQIRTELEQHMNCNLKEYKEFIDNEMLLILGQMDKATLIFDHVYLGSEWNASNLEELQETGVGYILNVTREIDNFFPGTFNYHNVRVYDEDSTDLLAHWNDTYNFIIKAKKNHSKCLVHCKMGVSRSASTVIAYAMKEYGWSLEKSYNFVKQKRSITRPNTGFMKQLAEYEGILDASKQRHNKLWQPDLDCEMAEGLPASCGADELEPSMSPCCEEALSDKGAACLPRPTVSLHIDPAYNNYYFRRLSDSALDSEPSTPVRGPPLLGMEKVFIEIDDVERDALLDDEAFVGQEGLPLAPFGSSAECTSAQAGAEPLEELRMRLEFSTVEEEDEEDAQKEEAEMEVLMQPDKEEGATVEGDSDGNGMDLAAMNENSNNNNNNIFLGSPHNTTDGLSPRLLPGLNCCEAVKQVPPPHTTPCLNWSPSIIVSASVPCDHFPSEGLALPTGHIGCCKCANCAGPPPAIQSDKPQFKDKFQKFESKTRHLAEDLSETLPKMIRLDSEEKPTLACLSQQQETLLQLRKSGLVRRRAERLERLSGLTREHLPSLKPLHTCQISRKSSFYTDEEEEFSCIVGDFAKSSTPCQVHLEPLVLPLTNEALMGVVGSGLLTPASSPRGSALTRSSSSESVRSVKGRPGLVRQRAQEIETRMRLAGLTLPSQLKRSNSLAKLGSLNFSSEDLCSGCSADAETFLLLSLSSEQDSGLQWHSNPTPNLSQLCKELQSPERRLTWKPHS